MRQEDKRRALQKLMGGGSMHPTELNNIRAGTVPGYNLVTDDEPNKMIEILSDCMPCMEQFECLVGHCFSNDPRGMNIYYNLIAKRYETCKIRSKVECPICNFYTFYKEKSAEIKRNFFKKK